MKREAVVPSMIAVLMVFALFSSCAKRESSNAQVASLEQEQVKASALEELRARPRFTSAIGSIFQDSRGNYWFGSHSEGVARFDGESFRYFSVKEGLPVNQVRSIQEDRNGRIWFGTANGVASWDGKTLTNHSTEIALQAGKPLKSEWAKSDNDLWFNAGINQGVYRYDGKSLGYLALPASTSTTAFEPHVATGFAKGKKGIVWIATYASVFGYAGKDFTTINNATAGFVDGPGKLHVRSILEDSKGRLWIGNNGIGVLLVDGDTTIEFSKEMGLVPVNSQRAGDPSPQGTLEHVFSIEEDRFGNIWFGDRDTGAWKYDGKSMTNFSIQDGLPSLSIWEIYRDNKGGLLFGLNNGIVCTFDGRSFHSLPAPMPPY